MFTLVKNTNVNIIRISDSGLLGLFPLPHTEFSCAWMKELFFGTLGVRHFFRDYGKEAKELARAAYDGLDAWVKCVCLNSAILKKKNYWWTMLNVLCGTHCNTHHYRSETSRERRFPEFTSTDKSIY